MVEQGRKGGIGNRKGLKGRGDKETDLYSRVGGCPYSNNNIRVWLRESEKRRGFNWMCASLSGVLEKWGLQRNRERFGWEGVPGKALGSCGNQLTLFLDGRRRIGVPLSAGLMSLKCWDFIELSFYLFIFYFLFFLQK